MSFPNYPDKTRYPALVNAKDMIEYRRRVGRSANLPRLEGVVFCLERGLPERMRWRIPIRLAGRMGGELYTVKKKQNRVAVMTNFGAGAPVVAELAEEFIAMGAKRLALMTGGGGLQPDLTPGDIVVCSRAIRDEGTSHHYLPPAKTVLADGGLAERLAAAIRARGRDCRMGTTWTTDAPFRETREELQQYQSEGVMTVEMESAALFTIGQVRGVQTASVVVIMDRLTLEGWMFPERFVGVRGALEDVYAALIEAVAG